jgi:hypothetical protein
MPLASRAHSSTGDHQRVTADVPNAIAEIRLTHQVRSRNQTDLSARNRVKTIMLEIDGEARDQRHVSALV